MRLRTVEAALALLFLSTFARASSAPHGPLFGGATKLRCEFTSTVVVFESSKPYRDPELWSVDITDLKFDDAQFPIEGSARVTWHYPDMPGDGVARQISQARYRRTAAPTGEVEISQDGHTLLTVFYPQRSTGPYPATSLHVTIAPPRDDKRGRMIANVDMGSCRVLQD